MKKFVTLLVTLLVIASLSFCAVAEEKPFAGQTLTISTLSCSRRTFTIRSRRLPAQSSSWIRAATRSA